MQPAILSEPQIPIYIRNTFNSSFRGSRIFTSSTSHTEREKCVCGFSSIEGMALINVEGSGLMGVPGMSKRLFGTLETLGINIVLIAQASSEHSVTFTTTIEQSLIAKNAIEEEFHKELKMNHITSVETIAPCSIIAAVGDGMKLTAGVCGLFFSALGDAKINVMSIAQGCGEKNISAVVMTDESTRALRAVHAAFHLSKSVVRVGIVGSNDLSHALLRILETQRNKLSSVFEIDLKVCVVLTEKGEEDGKLITLKDRNDKSEIDTITMSAYQLALEQTSPNPQNNVACVMEGGIYNLTDYLVSKDCAHTVIFDCTADEDVGVVHPQWLTSGVDVVTANNTGLSGSRELRNEIKTAETLSGKLSAKYLREVTIGGGLPIINTLRDLLHTGDQIKRIDGIMSISMSYIMHRIAPNAGANACDQFDEDISRTSLKRSFSLCPESNLENACSFSEAVNEAIALGLMEVNPLKDLSNEYTARCLMVLARELGIDDVFDIEKIQMSSDMLMVDVEERKGGIVTKKDESSIDVYSKISVQIDEQMRDRVASAAKKGCVPRHVASIDVVERRIDIKIVDVPTTHVFAITPASCECVRFFTRRHNRYPLVVQGPSEGVESTASALLAEFLNFMQSKVGGRKVNPLTRFDSGASLT